MCGRFTLKTDPKVIAAQFNVAALAVSAGSLSDLSSPIVPIASDSQTALDSLKPNFNVAPTHKIPAVLATADQIIMANFSWGLVPSWAKDPAIGSRMINARSETVAEKPSFRSALNHRRCIVPADGWYEWANLAGKKRPHYFSAKDLSLIGFAGIYESWMDPTGNVLWTVSILTQPAKPEFAEVHDRMPVLVATELMQVWLSAENQPLAQILETSAQVAQIQHWEVGPAVGNVRNNSADLTSKQMSI
jgi:putative SOS response-associated peptidase YedK